MPHLSSRGGPHLPKPVFRGQTEGIRHISCGGPVRTSSGHGFTHPRIHKGSCICHPHGQAQGNSSVEGKDIFLIDMGATCSTLPEVLGLSLPSSISVVGVDSVLSQLKAIPLLSCALGDQIFSHSFLVLSYCPIPLLI